MKESEILKLKLVYEKLVEEGMSASDAKKKATEMYIEEHRNSDEYKEKIEKFRKELNEEMNNKYGKNRKTTFKFAPRESLTYSENEKTYDNDFIKDLLEDSIEAKKPLFNEDFIKQNIKIINEENLDILIFGLYYIDETVIPYLRIKHKEFIAKTFGMTEKYLDIYSNYCDLNLINNTQKDLIKNSISLLNNYSVNYSKHSPLNTIFYLFDIKNNNFTTKFFNKIHTFDYFISKVKLSINILKKVDNYNNFKKLDKMLKNYIQFNEDAEKFEERIEEKIFYNEKLSITEKIKKNYYEPYKNKYLLNKIETEINSLIKKGKIIDPLSY